MGSPAKASKVETTGGIVEDLIVIGYQEQHQSVK